MDRKTKKRRRAKREQWLRAFAREYGLDLQKLIVGFSLTAITSTVALIVLFRWGTSWSELADETFVQRAALVAAMVVLVVSAVVSLVINAFRASIRIAEEGQWLGDEFVFRTPKIAAIYQFAVTETPIGYVLKLPGIPTGALVRCRIALSPENKFWNVAVTPAHDSLDLRTLHLDRFMSARLSNDRTLKVSADVSRRDASPVVARVIIESWVSQ